MKRIRTSKRPKDERDANDCSHQPINASDVLHTFDTALDFAWSSQSLDRGTDCRNLIWGQQLRKANDAERQ